MQATPTVQKDFSKVSVQGMLSIGCALLGAACVIGADVDGDALHTALGNSAEFEGLPIDFVQFDVGAWLSR